VAAKEEFDRSTTEFNLAENTLQRARVEYKRGFLKTPIAGLVNHVYVDAGEFVGRGAPVIDLVDIDKIKVHVSMPETDVRYIRAGQRALVTIDAFPGRHFEGTIDFVAYKADPVTKTFQTRIIMENSDHLIRPGMIARATLLRRLLPDALAVPLSALVDKEGERVVYVVKDGIAHARTVSIGVISRDRVQIEEGIAAGDRVIVVGQTEVEEGMRVRIQ
jgi:membrane fusion protein (multidrug efflux system)